MPQHLSLAAYEHPPAGNRVFCGVLCSSFATRDSQFKEKLFQGPKCEDHDSGE
jgi:hypothetical protein